jgi:hypothetical protein
MAKKKLTRKRVNEPLIDSALQDIYNKIETLQPSEELSITDTPEEGVLMSTQNSNGDTVSIVYNKSQGWLVDINSNFQPVGTKGFIPAFGQNGRSGIPIKGESLRYDRNKLVTIGASDSSKTDVILKNDAGVLNIRNSNDTADAVINAKSMTLSADVSTSDVGSVGYDADNLMWNFIGSQLLLNGIASADGTDTHMLLISEAGSNTLIGMNDGATPRWRFGNQASSNNFIFSVGATFGSNIAYSLDAAADDANAVFSLFYNSTNHCKITTAASGLTTIATTDSDGTLGHLKLNPDGQLVLDPGTSQVAFNSSTTQFGLISMEVANYLILSSILNYSMRVQALGTGNVELSSATGVTKFLLGGDADDLCTLTVAANGVTTIATADSDGAVGHLTLDPDGDLLLQPVTHTYSALPIGFTQNEPTFDATDTIITFSTTGNKQKLTLTDNCTDIHFKFPAVSGNFICVLLQDGSGSRTISNWKTQDAAGNAGAGNSGLVLWAGGTAPSNTETADKADIASFYWDADNEIAYGTYTYNF